VRHCLHAAGVLVLGDGALQRRVVRVRGGDGRVMDFFVGAVCRPRVWIRVRVPSLLGVEVSGVSLT